MPQTTLRALGNGSPYGSIQDVGLFVSGEGTAMTRRAVIFVPGFAKREQLNARDQLVQSLLHYTDGWKTSAADATDIEGQNVVRITATDRRDGSEVMLDLYEAYWGDLVPDWSNESPWQRFKRGLTLILYWVLGGLLRSLRRGELPARTMLALVGAALILLCWYVITFLVLVKAVVAGGAGLPDVVTSVTDAFGVTATIEGWAGQLAAWPVAVFLIGLLGMGKLGLETTANVAAFTKAYLRDESIGESLVGLRAKSRQRVVSMLDHVHGRKGDAAYDEVYVVAHSLGGAIAVDALAEYGQGLRKTTLLTWGTALGALVKQEPQIETEIRKFYTSETPIRNWVDVVFTRDVMGSKVPRPHKEGAGRGRSAQMPPVFPDTVTPRLPKGAGFAFDAIHNGYYRCEDALVMLVQKADDLPQRKDSA